MLHIISDYVVSKIFVDKPKIPNEKYQKVKPIIDEVSSYASVVDEVEVDKPGTWVNGCVNLITQMVEEPKHQSSPTTMAMKKMLKSPAYLGDQYDFICHYAYQSRDYKIIKDLESKKIAKMNTDLDILLVIENKEEKDSPNEYIPQFFFDEDSEEKTCDYVSELSKYMWEKHDSIIIDHNTHELTCEEYEFKNTDYYGDLNSLIDDWQSYMDNGIRRVIILQGMPGTGKSTLCGSASKRISNKTIYVTHDFIKHSSDTLWYHVINGTNPEMVIVDDIDRLPGNVIELSLPKFEEPDYNVPITLFTTNNDNKLPSAFKRPGRVDQIIDMPEPSEEIKRGVINSFCEDVGLDDTPDEVIDHLVEVYNKIPSGAYVKEHIRRYKVKGFDYEPPDFDKTFKELRDDPSSPSY